MDSALVIPYVESRRRQLKAVDYDLSYTHLTLAGGQRQEIASQGQMYLLVRADPGVYIQSDTGRYYTKSDELEAQMHEHSGQLLVQNNSQQPQNVEFVVVTWQYSPARPASN